MGSEMCIRDSTGMVESVTISEVPESEGNIAEIISTLRSEILAHNDAYYREDAPTIPDACLLYTSDAADERSSVDLGGRRIIKKKKKKNTDRCRRRRTEITTAQ